MALARARRLGQLRAGRSDGTLPRQIALCKALRALAEGLLDRPGLRTRAADLVTEADEVVEVLRERLRAGALHGAR